VSGRDVEFFGRMVERGMSRRFVAVIAYPYFFTKHLAIYVGQWIAWLARVAYALCVLVLIGGRTPREAWRYWRAVNYPEAKR
jgi:hypothetical protein